MKQKTTQSGTSTLDYMPEVLQNNNNGTNSLDLSTDLLISQPEPQIRETDLELINQDLINSNKPDEISSKKYSDFFDYAPTGYLLLSKEGRIKEINPIGTSIMGKKRQHLINTLFGFFVSIESKAIFNLFLSKIFDDDAQQACEMVLKTEGLVPVNVRVTGIAGSNRDECMVTLTDSNERMPIIRHREEINSEFFQFEGASSTPSIIH